MARVTPTFDPYRVLGLLRGATPAEIKAAHRRLAKRYHPDGSKGNEIRFLAIQEAYQLLSDPARRREWDRAHAPGPVRAGGRTRTTGADPATRGPDPRPGATRVRRRRRTTTPRRRTWSAEHVPWWQDFRPGARTPPTTAAGGPLPEDDRPNDFDVFDRSSGAAWSAAARRHFRRGTDDLPSRGVWRYRGTQVVTGAEARKIADEEEEKRTP
ncbi:MAG: J domain-containing protein [Candidatus Limnocylindrales bacterium]